jgi:hypothetical protein
MVPTYHLDAVPGATHGYAAPAGALGLAASRKPDFADRPRSAGR